MWKKAIYNVELGKKTLIVVCVYLLYVFFLY